MSAPSPSPSPNTLLRPKSKRRLSTLNFGMIFIIVGLVGAIVLILAYSISQMNAKPSSGIVNGAPVTQGSTPQDLGMTGPSSRDVGSAADPDAEPAVTKTAVRVVATATTAPQATLTPSQPAPQGGGGAAEDEAASQAREARRRAAEDASEQLRRRQERTDSAMRSLGGVTVADQRDGSAGVVSDEPRAGEAQTPFAAVQAREYSAPSGPTLALDTSIPVELTRSVDSTFGGQFEVRVTSDVLDETQRSIVIPRETRCFAKASQGGVEGQARLYVAVTLCKLPDRKRLVLDNFPGIDTDGATGIKARVDDHGAGRHGRSSSLMSVPGMLAGTVIPGAGAVSGVASSAAYAAQAGQVGQAMPGPTLYIDASPQRPRSFSILVTQDTAVRAYNSDVAASEAAQ